MNKRTKLAERKLPNYTRGEEIFNMVTHIVGAAFGVAMLVLGIVFAAVRGHVAGVLTAIVFGLSLIVLYTMSAVYHGLSPRSFLCWERSCLPSRGEILPEKRLIRPPVPAN